ncbi:hypothetical protein H4Q32_015343 [Labeo rohita]|uniref:Uncharacterized protein n=1 Tax=Labeo rohita TaxID=84645 RepID=A0ABQ8LG62_LABRO|nr:hypothetical protein H4Q32_015343 [Labeo rohita]
MLKPAPTTKTSLSYKLRPSLRLLVSGWHYNEYYWVELETVWLCVTNGTDSVWSVRDQLSEQRSRDTRDSELSLTLLCSTDAQDSVCDSHGSSDQTPTESLGSDCDAGEQQMLQTPLNMCSVKLLDCTKMKMKRETTAEEQQGHDDDNDFIPSATPYKTGLSAIVTLSGLPFASLVALSVDAVAWLNYWTLGLLHLPKPLS